ncbi:MAG TPA: FG-GAP-like repeat-containing protein [Pirellulales bacterium]|nr:FG-GAP-like repeat-containing protein [Pirellulales bacterium]
MTTLYPAPRRTTDKACPVWKAGFSLIELAIVITIIALVTAASVNMGQSMIQSADIVATNHKLNVIEQALEAYRLANERLPCPADASALSTSATYGTETANTGGECDDGTPAGIYTYLVPKGANATNIAFNTYVAEGAVPFKALNLPESFMYDAWGRKFAYAVWTVDAAESAFLNYGITPSCGAITVNDASGNHRSQSSIYAVVSFGPDGHGGYLENGTRYNAKSVNVDEDANGHYTSAGANISYTATYVDKAWSEDTANSLDDFSDLVRFRERWQMSDKRDYFSPLGMPCTLGFRIDGAVANDRLTQGTSLGNTTTSPPYDVNNDRISDIVLHSTTCWALSACHDYVIFGAKGGWPPVIDLSSYNFTGSNGFEISLNTGDAFAPSIVGLADVDGDGNPDLVTEADNQGTRTLVIFGPGNGGTFWPLYNDATPASRNEDGTHFAAIYDSTARIYSHPAAVGKFTTDTAAGILISGGDSGGVTANMNFQFIRGKSRPWASNQNAASLTEGTQIIRYTSVGDYNTEMMIADVNGDGVGDIITTNRGGAPVDVIYGGAGPGGNWGGPYDFGNINTANNPGGISIGTPNGATQYPYFTVASGDMNNDGKNDLVSSEVQDGTDRTFVMYGPLGTTSLANGWNPATQLNGTTGVTFTSGAHAVMDLFTDLNGDGVSDFVRMNSTGSNCCGVNTVDIAWGGNSFGSAYTFGSDGKSTVVTAPTSTSAYLTVIASADLNGDGINDLIIAVPGANTVYIIWGQATWPSTINLSTLTATQGTIISSPSRGGSFGATVSTGDINGDGVTDLIICAPGQTNNAYSNSGSCYVIWGHKGAWKPTINDSDIT